MIVVLDSGPLGFLTNPRGGAKAAECADWVLDMQAHGHTIAVAEIADYEIRRELIRAGLSASVEELNALADAEDIRYLPLTTETMKRAAELWAEVRSKGLQTADDRALDGDVILAAQAQLLASREGRAVVVATDNVGHLSRFVEAKSWRDLR